MDKKQGKLPKTSNKKNYRNLIFAILILFFGFVAFSSYSTPKEELETIPLSETITKGNNGELSKIEVTDDELTITVKGSDEATLQSTKEPGSSIYEQGLERNEKNQDLIVNVIPPANSGQIWQDLLVGLLPVIINGGFGFFRYEAL